MFFPGLDIVMRHQMEQLLAADGPNTVTAKFHWRTVTKPPGYDPDDESSTATVSTADHELAFRALAHQVDHRLSGFQRFMEIQTGDLIVDYLADLDLENPAREDHRIEINGRYFIQKSAGTPLKEAWDIHSGTGGYFKTLLLTPAP